MKDLLRVHGATVYRLDAENQNGPQARATLEVEAVPVALQAVAGPLFPDSHPQEAQTLRLVFDAVQLEHVLLALQALLPKLQPGSQELPFLVQ